MKKNSSLNGAANPTCSASGGFTLLELLVVILIIILLAALALMAMQRMNMTARETKSLSVLRNVLQAGIRYSGDNDGDINTLRYDTDYYDGKRTGRWVGDTFWGRLQPYLFSGITTTNQVLLKAQIEPQLVKLFGCTDIVSLNKMKGTPFEGSPLYGDTSGWPVPFAINTYLYKYCYDQDVNPWVKQQRVYSLPSTIYATYGWGTFNETDGAKPYSEMPKARYDAQGKQLPFDSKTQAKIYYLPSKRAIVGFLDGRVEFLAPPIADRMIKIDGTGQ